MSLVENKSQPQYENTNTSQPFPSEIVDHTTENGQVVWFKSAPKEVSKSTSDQESEYPKV